MKKQSWKLMMFLGLLALIGSFSLMHFTKVNDALPGFLFGLGSTVILGAFVKKIIRKNKAA